MAYIGSLTTTFLLLSISYVGGADFDAILKTFPNIATIKDRAINWVLIQRKHDWGWGSDTARVISTLQLANDTLMEVNNLESQLSIKQMEIELLLSLWSRNHDNPLRAGRLAQFIHALVATCHDPRSFHGHDLIAMLEHLDMQHPFEFSYSILALCNAGVHIRKKQFRHLLSIVDTVESAHIHDTTAMLVMALACVTKEHHNRNLLSILHKPIKRLKKMQKEDGSFGNLHTSALATQALLSTSDSFDNWNGTKAVQFLLSQHQEDGSFGNMLATTAVLPILAGHSYMHLKNTSCREEISDDGSQEVSPTKSSQEDIKGESKSITVDYSIWIGSNITKNYTLSITVHQNTSFYEIMKQAAETDERFEFAASLWPNGHYVHTLSGLRENSTVNHYWLLGLYNNPPQNPVFVDMGVDDFYPKEGDNIVFWYKQI